MFQPSWAGVLEHEGRVVGASRSPRSRQRLLDAVPIAHPAARARRPRRADRGVRPGSGQARAGRHAARHLRGRREPGGAARAGRRRRGTRPDEHERARPAGARCARGRQARARREADGDVARGGRRPSSRQSTVEPACWSARRTSSSRPRTARCTDASTMARSDGSCSLVPVTAGPVRGGARWFYQPGGGSLFDLGIYNLTSLCGFFGSVRRVTALVGIAIPRASRRRASR